MTSAAPQSKRTPRHYIDLRVKPVDDLSDPETTPFRVYYETAAGDRYFTVMETVTDLCASRIVSHTIPNSNIVLVAFPDEHVETVGYTEVKPGMLDALALFQSIPNAPITVTHTSYINFAMNGVYYSYELDNNPFFSFHYLKTPIDPKSETYSGDACMEESSKSWFTDPLIGFGCPDSEIESAAEAILSLLLAAPLSTIRHDTKRTRIPNAYDSGYHFENIPVKERRIKIDF